MFFTKPGDLKSIDQSNKAHIILLTSALVATFMFAAVQYFSVRELALSQKNVLSEKLSLVDALKMEIGLLQGEIKSLHEVFDAEAALESDSRSLLIDRSLGHVRNYLAHQKNAAKIAEEMAIETVSMDINRASDSFPKFYHAKLIDNVMQESGNFAEIGAAGSEAATITRNFSNVFEKLNTFASEEKAKLNTAIHSIQSMERASWNMFVVFCATALVFLTVFSSHKQKAAELKSTASFGKIHGVADHTIDHTAVQPVNYVEQLQLRTQSFAIEQRERNGRARVQEFEELYSTLDDSIETMILSLRLLSSNAQNGGRHLKGAQREIDASTSRVAKS